MTKTNKAPLTITVQTGKRVWNLTVVAQDGNAVWLVSKSGKTYKLNLATKLMEGRNKDKNGRRRSYDWDVTNIAALRESLGYRRPKLALAA